jgi:hypothetical protein
MAFYDLASPSKHRRPWWGVTRNVDRVQAAGGSVELIRRALHRAVDEMCDVMLKRDRRLWQVDADDTPRAA